MYIANRFGLVTSVSLALLALTMIAPFAFFTPAEPYSTYIVMTVPVLIASFRLVSWSGLVAAGLLFVGTFVSRCQSP